MASECEGPNDAAEDSKSRKTRFNFKDEHDLLLLREVLGDDGLFSNRESPMRDCWKNIAQRLQLNGMAKFIDDERQSKKASGVDEENDEKVQLLTEYHRGGRAQRGEANKTKKEEADREGGKAIQDAALESIKPIQKKTDDKRFCIHTYLEANQRICERQTVEDEATKRPKLDIEERQISIQEKQLEIQQQSMALMSMLLAQLSKQ
ncbi:hypothetical protein AC1031_001457 [Aphanomyces cochlioides]|nr:hypothetical protein AC1031_001457 [Aphanomyces cochlioides]